MVGTSLYTRPLLRVDEKRLWGGKLLLESLWDWLCCCLEHGGDFEDGDGDALVESGVCDRVLS